MINVEYLKQMMEENNMTRRDFCRKGRVEESSVCRLFKGERSVSLGFFEGIARCFPDADLRSFLILEEDADAKSAESDAIMMMCMSSVMVRSLNLMRWLSLKRR